MFGTMPSVRAPRWARWLALTTLAAAGLVAITSCERRRGCAGEYCGTLVFAAPGEPDILLPAVTQQQYAQDIAGQLFLKLADLGLSQNTIGDEDFQPQLAQRWEWDDPLTLVFHLDPRAHWQDGRPVTAADVAFTFDISTDPLVNSPFRSSLKTISAVTTRDSLSAVFRFHARYPEMFYDAVYHMRILPAHLLRPVPRSQWRSAALGRAPVGDGPYRFVAWKAGEGGRPRGAAPERLGRPRPGPSRPARPHLVDLGPRDPGAAVRHGPGRAVAHAARLARLERRRHPGPGRPSVGLPHPGANDEPAAAAVRAASAGAVPSHRGGCAARRSRVQRVRPADAGGPVRCGRDRPGDRPHAVLVHWAGVDVRRTLQRRPLRQPGVRPAGGRGDRSAPPRRGEARVAARN